MTKRNTTLAIALASAITGGAWLSSSNVPSDYTNGDWRVHWVESPVDDGECKTHEVEGYCQGRLVFKDRIRQFGHRGDEAASALGAIKASTKQGTEPRIIEGPHGTVSTFEADSTDGTISCGGTASWADVRSGGAGRTLNQFGTGLLAWGCTESGGGVDHFGCHQIFLKFNTSTLPDTDTISGAVLQMDLQTAYDDNGDAYQLRLTTDWGTLVANDDYIDGTSFAALTSLSEVDYGAVQSSGYTDFTITSPNTNITKTGTVYVVGATKFFADNTTPTANSDGGWDWEPTEEVSDTKSPQLVVTHAAGGGGGTVRFNVLGGGTIGGNSTTTDPIGGGF